MRVACHSVVLRCLWVSSALLFPQTIWPQVAAPLSNVPPALRPPAGELILAVKGKGKQVYVCQNAGAGYAWKLKGPEAQLFGHDGELVGRHFAGPTWESNDGSRITGKSVASVPSPDPSSIPWLLLTVTSHEGQGIMMRVQSIQRLETQGGEASASCSERNNGEKMSAPYQANYYFYGTPAPRSSAPLP